VAVAGLAFGRLHLMTLVFGATLLGVAVDYGLHYLCQVLWGTGRRSGSPGSTPSVRA